MTGDATGGDGGAGAGSGDDLGVTLRAAAGLQATILAGAGEATGGAGAAAPEGLARGAAIGRYLVLDRLGAGGMGVVYAAYDPELDRKVAIKILRREAADERTTAGRSRLQREAQAMARLSHPNVVAVHDVGVVDGQVFVAMEFIDGETLTAWLARARPPWPEIVRVFLAAGAGLQAAHAAGMVHRDFKPDNVLIGRGGGVKVSDFGLARSVDEAPAAAGPGRDPGASLIAATRRLTGEVTSLTAPGSLLGTPLYMAPEQLLGHAADARSDLYAFSVSLYEALYGRLPHQGATLGALIAQVLDEAPAPPPRGPVPAHFAAIVLRGLEKDPARRYPSMAALLADLAVDPRRRRRRRLVAAGGGALALALVVGAFSQERAQERRCAAAAAGLAEVWSEGRVAAIEGAFTALDRPFVADSLAAALTLAGAHVDAWSRAAAAACEAHLLRGETTAEAYALQEACLGHQRARFDALVELLARADAEAAARAIDAIAELPAPAACLDVDRVRVAFAAGDGDPAAIERIRGAIDRGQALIATGRAAEAAPIAAAAAADARASGFLPVIAAAELLHAQALALADDAAAVDAFHRALAAAIAAGDDVTAARAAIDLARALVDLEDRLEDGRRWLDLAASWIVGDDDPILAIDVLRVRARIARERGEAAAARAHLEAAHAHAARLGPRSPVALALRIQEAELDVDDYDLAALRARADALLAPLRGLYGADHPTYARALTALGLAALAADEVEEGERQLREADAIVRRAFGERHRRVGESTVNLAQIAVRRGDYEGALARFREARAIFAGALGPDHSLVGVADNNTGNMLKHLERHEEATRYFQEAAEIRRRAGVKGRYAPLMNLASTRYEQAWTARCEGDEAAAREHFAASAAFARESLAEALREVGRDHLHVGVIRTSLGLTLAAIGQDREGLEEFRAALAINEAALGPRSSQLAFALLGIGRTLHNLGRDAEAIPYLERALALPDFGGDQGLPHEIALELAMALWDGGGDRERALRLARASRDYYVGRGTPATCESAGRWLRERGVGR